MLVKGSKEDYSRDSGVTALCTYKEVSATVTGYS